MRDKLKDEKTYRQCKIRVLLEEGETEYFNKQVKQSSYRTSRWVGHMERMGADGMIGKVYKSEEEEGYRLRGTPQE